MKTILIPQPCKIAIHTENRYIVKSSGYIAVTDKAFFTAVVTAKQYFLKTLVVTIGRYRHEAPQILLEKADFPEEGYRLVIDENGVVIAAGSERGAFYALMTLRQMHRQYGNALPFAEISDEPYYRIRGYMLDISRNKIPTLAHLKQKADMLCGLKMNHLELYIEGAPFPFRNHPRAWAGVSVLTGEEIAEFDRYCRERFIELVPTQNTFGHMGSWLTNTEGYRHLAECPEGFVNPQNGGFVPWALCLDPTNPEAFSFVEDLSDNLLDYFSSDKYNVCCDETLELGLGKSKPVADQIGKGRVYLNYLLQLHDYCLQNGKTMLFWADIINEYPELVPEIPKDVLALNWGYYNDLPTEESCAAFENSGVPYCVCPGSAVWNTVVGNTTQMLENVRDTIMKGYRHSAVGVIITDWGDNGHIQGIAPSYPAIVYSAAMSWQPVINAQINLPAALNMHIFADRANIMGDAVLDIGRYVEIEERRFENTSATFRFLTGALDNESLTEHLAESDLDRVDTYLSSFCHRIDVADMQCADAELIQREYRLGIRILRYGIFKARYILRTKQSGEIQKEMLRQIHKEAERIVNEFTETWLQKNKLSLIHKSLRMFIKDMEYADLQLK